LAEDDAGLGNFNAALKGHGPVNSLKHLGVAEDVVTAPATDENAFEAGLVTC
jgi:hypothetical protein